MQVATFLARCAACQREFGYPLLSDFAYGELIWQRQDGRAFRHLWAIGHPTWDTVSGILGKARADALQRVMAHLADPDEGLRFTQDMICHLCGSTRFAFWGGDRVGTIEVAEASYAGFEGLSANQQRDAVLAALA